MDINEFYNPGKEYRPSVFWSWNDKLDKDEIRRQIREMKQQGFGGFFMHSRIGLITPYMSEEWMEAIGTGIVEAKHLDMEAWLYDEDKWPSGFAGGLIPMMGEEMQSKVIVGRWTTNAEELKAMVGERTLGLFALELDKSSRIQWMQKLEKGDWKMWRKVLDEKTFEKIVSEENCKTFFGYMHIGYETTPKDKWYNGETYVDLLNPKVISAFIESTHVKYAERFGKDFGPNLPGIFTDEPNIGRWPYQAAWTQGLQGYCKEWCGIDILPTLVLLFLDGDGDSEIRYAYWRTLLKLFIQSFSEPLGRWCEEHNWQLTGHYLLEDDIINQTLVLGAAMPHYFHMQIPGIDHLFLNIDFPLAKKQVSSAAHQMGKGRVLSEMYAGTGQKVTFEQLKWIADFHFALGVTFVNPHLSLYSISGERKRDWPPTLSCHQPYWKYMYVLNNYLSRCSYALQQGKYVADILLLNPVQTAWATAACPMQPNVLGNNEKLGRGWGTCESESRNAHIFEWQQQLDEIILSLLGSNLNFDMGDDYVMESMASTHGGRVILGQASYDTVIMPPSMNWSHTLYDFLVEWCSEGGRLLIVGKLPVLIDGRQATDQWLQLTGHSSVRFVADKYELEQILLDEKQRGVYISYKTQSFADDKNEKCSKVIYTIERVTEKGRIIFCANSDIQKGYDTEIIIKSNQQISEWDLRTGAVRPMQEYFCADESVYRIRHYFESAGSMLLVEGKVYDNMVKGIPLLQGDSGPDTEFTIPLPDSWEFKRLEENILPLDYCDVEIEGVNFGLNLPIYKVRKEILKRCGVEDKLAFTQPWSLRENMQLLSVGFKMTYRFEIIDIPEALSLVSEKAKGFNITINGKSVEYKDNLHHWDIQFLKIDITALVNSGCNEICISGVFTWDTEIEDIYLVGEFALRERPDNWKGKLTSTYALVAEPGFLHNGSWTEQGYPFYSGSMRYKTSIHLEEKNGRYILDLGEPQANLILLHLDGEMIGVLPWRPWKFDLTDFLEKKTHCLEIDVVSTLRNTLGPLHNKTSSDDSPLSFIDEVNWTDKYNVLSYGIMGPISDK